MVRLQPPLRAILIGLLVAACGSTAPTSVPSPAATPTSPAATPTVRPPTPGPTERGVQALAGTGAIDRGTFASPDGFEPSFTFDLRADGWQEVTPPDEYGFVLATPNAFRPDVLMGVLKPVSTTADAFSAELTENGLLDATVTISDREIGGVAARSYVFKSTIAKRAFAATSQGSNIETSFGGDLAENRFIYVEHPRGPFVIVMSLGPSASIEQQFAFDALVDSIAFR